MRLSLLADQAVLARFDTLEQTLRYAAALRAAGLPGVVDVVQSFRSVAAFLAAPVDPADAGDRLGALREAMAAIRPVNVLPPGRTHVIPCCYEMGPDLAAVAAARGLTVERVIELHLAATFTVAAIGFCPGYPYLTGLPAELAGLPRLARPRTRVPAGSVGIAVEWCGVYTQEKPGGWNLIGRTPAELVNEADDYFPLRPGDSVRFERVDAAGFARGAGRQVASTPA
jgi:inhibitor of KinA